MEPPIDGSQTEFVKDGILYRARPVPQTFHIKLIGCKKLSRVGMLGNKPTSYGIVKFEGREIGRTDIVRKTQEPKFVDENFSCPLPKGVELLDCVLQVYIYDLEARADPTKSKHRFLGQVTLTGQELFYLNSMRESSIVRIKSKRRSTLLAKMRASGKTFDKVSGYDVDLEEDDANDKFEYHSEDDSDKDEQRTMWSSLIFAEDLKAEEQNLVGDGQIELSGWLEKPKTVWEADETPKDLNIFANDNPDIEKENPDGITDMIEIVVYAARGLSRVDLFRGANPFVVVTLNDRVLGRTEMILQTTNPRWDHERIFVPVMSGLRARSANLKVEVFSEDLRNETTTFLGEAVFLGNDFVKLVGGRCNQFEKLGDNPTDGNGAVKSNPTWFPIKQNIYKSLIENKNVQGEIQLSGGYRPRAYRLADGLGSNGKEGVVDDDEEEDEDQLTELMDPRKKVQHNPDGVLSTSSKSRKFRSRLSVFADPDIRKAASLTNKGTKEGNVPKRDDSHRLALFIAAAWDVYEGCTDVFVNVRLDGHTVARTAIVSTLGTSTRQYSSEIESKMHKSFTFDQRVMFPVDWDDRNDRPHFYLIEVSLYGAHPSSHSFVFLGSVMLDMNDISGMQVLKDKDYKIMSLQQSDYVDHQPYVTNTGHIALRTKFQKSDYKAESDLALACIDLTILEAQGLELSRRFPGVADEYNKLMEEKALSGEPDAAAIEDGAPQDGPFQVDAVVKWMGLVCGKTRVHVDSQVVISVLSAPSFRLMVPRDVELVDTRLQIELYLVKSFSGVALGGAFLGRVSLSGKHLGTLSGAIKPQEEAAVSSPSGRMRKKKKTATIAPSWLDLTSSEYEEEEINKEVRGGVRISASYTAAHGELEANAPDAPENKTLSGEITRRRSVISMERERTRSMLLLAPPTVPGMSPTRDPRQQDRRNAMQSTANSVKLELGIVSASKLQKEIKFGRCNALVRIIWNDIEVACTGFVKDSNNPVWPANSEVFLLKVPSGMHLSQCTLKLILLDKLRSFEDYKVMGECSLDADQLNKMVKKSQNSAPGANTTMTFDVLDRPPPDPIVSKKKDKSTEEILPPKNVGLLTIRANLHSVSNERKIINAHIRKNAIEAAEMISAASPKGKNKKNKENSLKEKDKPLLSTQSITTQSVESMEEYDIYKEATASTVSVAPTLSVQQEDSWGAYNLDDHSASQEYYNHDQSAQLGQLQAYAQQEAYVGNSSHQFEKHIDPSTGRFYYYDTVTQETTWDVPPGNIPMQLTQKQIDFQHKLKAASEETVAKIHHIRDTIIEKYKAVEVVEQQKVIAAEKEKDRKAERLIWHKVLMESVELDGECNLSWKTLKRGIDKGVWTFEKDYSIRMLALRLVGLNLTEIPEELFSNLLNLKTLHFTSNLLTTIPENIYRLTDLSELILLNNKIKTLPEKIGLLCSLSKLELANNKLESLPWTFAALSKLDRIDLESNLLKVLPENFESLFNCRALNLNNNILQRLPKSIGRMPSLVTLSASTNQLTYIPNEICQSKTIKVIRCNNNQIDSLPHNIGDIKKLKELSVCHNIIRQLPVSFYKLGKLVLLRMEGNPISLPTEDIMSRGAPAVVQWCREEYLHNEQNQMRAIVNATQLVLEEIVRLKIYDEALFRPPFKIEFDYFYGLQFDYLLDELIPKVKEIWHKENIKRKHTDKKGSFKTFPYTKKEVVWAWMNYGDAAGVVMRKEEAWFTRCKCVDSQGKRQPCVPPKIGFMCNRVATLMKSSLVLKRQKQERLWDAYITNGIDDAVKRAEKEAKDYLDSTEGALWLTQLAFEKAESLLEEKGAARALQWRDKLSESKKHKIIARYGKLKRRVEGVRDTKQKQMQDEIEDLKKQISTAREGYVKKTMTAKLDFLILSLSQLPENFHLLQLQQECDKECVAVDKEVYEVSSSDSSTDSEIDDEEDRMRKRAAREKKEIDSIANGKTSGLSTIDKLKQEIPALRPRHIFEQIYETTKLESKKFASKLKPSEFAPPGSLSFMIRAQQKNANKTMRTVLDIVDSKIRQIATKGTGNFDEMAKEMRYELYLQYVQHHTAVAKRKAETEFKAMATIRANWSGAGMRESFMEWKMWVKNKLRRVRRDLRYEWRRVYRQFASAMESVNIAEAQVLLWKRQNDSYSDTPYWKHINTGEMSWNKPNILMYLPANYEIPYPPNPLPPGVSIDDTSDEEKEKIRAKAGNRPVTKKEEKAARKREKVEINSKEAEDNPFAEEYEEEEEEEDYEEDEEEEKEKGDEGDEDYDSEEDNEDGETETATDNGDAFSELSFNQNEMDTGMKRLALGSGGPTDSARDSARESSRGKDASSTTVSSASAPAPAPAPQSPTSQATSPSAKSPTVKVQSNIADEVVVRDGLGAIKEWGLVGEAAIDEAQAAYEAEVAALNKNNGNDDASIGTAHTASTSSTFTYGPDSLRASNKRLGRFRNPIFGKDSEASEQSDLPKDVEDRLVAAKEFMLTEEYKSRVTTMPAVEPTDVEVMRTSEWKKASNKKEYERAFAVVSKVRSKISVARHNTYMNQITRHKHKSFEEIQGRKKKNDDEEEEKYTKPDMSYLLRITGGDHHIIADSSTEAMNIRTILAKRALKAKQRIHERAVEKGLAKPKVTNYWSKYIAPIWRENYEASSSDEEDTEAAKAAMRAKKKAKQEASAGIMNKWKSVAKP